MSPLHMLLLNLGSDESGIEHDEEQRQLMESMAIDWIKWYVDKGGNLAVAGRSRFTNAVAARSALDDDALRHCFQFFSYSLATTLPL